MKKYLILATLAIGVIIGASALSVLAANWTAPTATPPHENVAAPINVGDLLQEKLGSLIVKGLNVKGNMVISTTTGSGTTGKVLTAADDLGTVKWATLSGGSGGGGAVSSVTAGTGISVAPTTGAVVVTNTGVTSLNSATGTMRIISGTGISVTRSGNDITISLAGSLPPTGGWYVMSLPGSMTCNSLCSGLGMIPARDPVRDPGDQTGAVCKSGESGYNYEGGYSNGYYTCGITLTRTTDCYCQSK
jgi:hypothetical protein